MPRILALPFLLAALLSAQQKVQHEGRPALEFSNGRLSLVMLTEGGAFASISLKDDPKHTNPLWDPARMARETGNNSRPGPGTGHFLCVDGFGPTSREEIAAGLQFHGEANRQQWEVLESSATEATFRARLPLVHEVLTRRIRMMPGQPVVLVESELESELAFDRPILWAEHGTIGAPFLALGKVAVDTSATRCRTKPQSRPGQSRPATTLPGNQDFEWPVVTLGDQNVNLRVAPSENDRMNHVGCLLDPSRTHEFITALHTEEHLLYGYLFPRQDYPWVQHWMYYPSNGMYAWGVEFGMQPYDMTRRDVVALSPMFGTPTFRWLPAKSKLTTRFLMFLTRVPEGFTRVDDVRLDGGQLVLEDKGKGLRVSFAAPSL